MSKFKLADAAKAVLMNEGAKETFDANIASKRGGQDGSHKLSGDVAYGTKEVGDVGTKVTKTTDAAPDATKGAPTATPPGATPPVGAEGAKRLDAQFNQQSHGRGDLTASDEEEESSYENIRDRVKAKLAKQMFQSNPGATFQSYAEETVEEEEIVSEEKEEKEDHEDKAEDKAMIKKMMKKEKMKEEIESDVDALLLAKISLKISSKRQPQSSNQPLLLAHRLLLKKSKKPWLKNSNWLSKKSKTNLHKNLMTTSVTWQKKWMKENQLAIEKGLRAEIVEDFIGGLKDLFIEHYIDIPEEKVDVVEELTNKVEELESENDEQIQSSVELRKELNEHKKIEAIHAVCEGLTQTQVEKMKALAESLEFTNDEEFADKLVTLRTSYFTEQVKPAATSALNEEVIVEDEKKPVVSNDPTVAAIASVISKTLVK